MSAKFCGSCGHGLEQDAQFCPNCGAKQGGSDTAAQHDNQPAKPGGVAPPSYTSQQPPDQGQQGFQQQPQGYYPPQDSQPQAYMGGGRQYRRREYIRPPNYVFTQTIGERIKGTLRRDIHVIEEIEERADLQDEANKLLLACFSVLAIFEIFFTISFGSDSSASRLIYIVATRFLGGAAFIYLIAAIGKAIGGQETQTNTKEIIRVTAYAYVARLIDQFVLILFIGSGSVLLLFAFFGTLIYSALVFITVVTRALDRGIGTSIITIVLAAIISGFVNTVLGAILL